MFKTIHPYMLPDFKRPLLVAGSSSIPISFVDSMVSKVSQSGQTVSVRVDCTCCQCFILWPVQQTETWLK